MDNLSIFKKPPVRKLHGVLNYTTDNSPTLPHWTESAYLRRRVAANPILRSLNRIRVQFSLSGRRDRFFHQELKHLKRRKDALILDVACGGGRPYLTEYGYVVGLDVSSWLLKIAAEDYGMCVKADASDMPFKDNVFDAVISSDFLGHISPSHKKEAVLNEMARVLKPGGKLINIFEANSDSIWFSLARKWDFALFTKHFINDPGHLGLNYVQQYLNWAACSYSPLLFVSRIEPMCANVVECGAISALFNNGLKEHRGWMKLLVALDRVLAYNVLVRESLNVLLDLALNFEIKRRPYALNKWMGALVVLLKD
jgi:SAM-dependent methyltransferase